MPSRRRTSVADRRRTSAADCRRTSVAGRPRTWLATAIAGAAALAVAISGCATVHACSCGNPASLMVAGDSANGRTITVRVGESVRVTLSSSYWQFSGSSAPRVLRQDGRVVLLPRPRSCPAIPGLGCTPIRVMFTAVARGTAVIKANRSTCGEALRCVGRPTRYKLTVIVAS